VPTYGYRCEKCGHEFDVWQRMSDEAKAACPQCGSEGKRLFFPAGIVFKGSGFYKTDSRKSGSDGSSDKTSTTTSTPSTPPPTKKSSDTSTTSTAAAAAD
jgi:putative FmdB family regulatory protein